MSAFAILLWLLNLVFDTIGHLSFKAAATLADEVHGVQRWLRMAHDQWIWIGLLAFVGEFLIWVVFLAVVPLSVGVLMGSFNIIAVMLGGRLFFREKLTPKRLAAAALITLGVALVGLGQP